MQMCESQQEIDFSTIQDELLLPREEIEAFIIEGGWNLSVEVTANVMELPA